MADGAAVLPRTCDHHVFLYEKLWQLSSYIIYNTFITGVLLGEYKRGGRAELDSILQTTVLRQQRPVHIGRVLHSYTAQLHDYGGIMAVPVDATDDKPEESSAATEAQRNGPATEKTAQGRVNVMYTE